MTEKEKMLGGLPYYSRDQELLKMYHRARELLQKYNALHSTDLALRDELMEELFGHKGKGVWIEPPFYCDYGENITIGKNTFVNANCFFLDNNRIAIGENGLIGPYVQIYTASHPLKASERITEREGQTVYITRSEPVEIGDNVWIGGNSVLLPGTRVGNNVTIGAASVVKGIIPDGVLVLGNPARIVKQL